MRERQRGDRRLMIEKWKVYKRTNNAVVEWTSCEHDVFTQDLSQSYNEQAS